MEITTQQRILLIEPDYKNKYPPLGLMKISTYHKEKGDFVVFYKGCSTEFKTQSWDRIYISTLFTFHWDKTIDTIKFYLTSVSHPSRIYIGGVMATLMKKEIEEIVNVTVVEGLLNERGKLGYADDSEIDNCHPDYSIVDRKTNSILNYSYPTIDSYIAYSTRGCIRKCSFCAVPILEPEFSNSLSIANQVKAIKDNYGVKRNLLLLDNNILASNKFTEIIEEIKSIGFQKGAKIDLGSNSRKRIVNRFVDFNQGIDARLLDREKMELLSQIAIRPLRIAFDDIKYKDLYIEKIRLAAEYGIDTLSNYILFNYKDTPKDFYERLKINIDLNDEFIQKGIKSQIFSFPMKYSPISGEFCRNRKHVGEYWNPKYLRGVQCILLTTHGIVGPKREFFEKAFGKDVEEFLNILKLPEIYIIYRNRNLENGNVDILSKLVKSLDEREKNELWRIVFSNKFHSDSNLLVSEKLKKVLDIYCSHS